MKTLLWHMAAQRRLNSDESIHGLRLRAFWYKNILLIIIYNMEYTGRKDDQRTLFKIPRRIVNRRTLIGGACALVIWGLRQTMLWPGEDLLLCVSPPSPFMIPTCGSRYPFTTTKYVKSRGMLRGMRLKYTNLSYLHEVMSTVVSAFSCLCFRLRLQTFLTLSIFLSHRWTVLRCTGSFNHRSANTRCIQLNHCRWFTLERSVHNVCYNGGSRISIYNGGSRVGIWLS